MHGLQVCRESFVSAHAGLTRPDHVVHADVRVVESVAFGQGL